MIGITGYCLYRTVSQHKRSNDVSKVGSNPETERITKEVKSGPFLETVDSFYLKILIYNI